MGLNAQYFLKNGGNFVISIKASCIDSTAPPEAVFAREVKKLIEMQVGWATQGVKLRSYGNSRRGRRCACTLGEKLAEPQLCQGGGDCESNYVERPGIYFP